MSTRRIEAQQNTAAVRERDKWRAGSSPQPSWSQLSRQPLEERLCADRRAKGEHKPREVRPGAERLAALYVLERVSGFGPAKFRAMHDAGIHPRAAIENPSALPFRGRTGEKLRQGIAALSDGDLAAGQSRAVDQLKRAEQFSASILVHGDGRYPERVYASNNPVPVLYVRGDPAIWDRNGSVAIVGSRKTRAPYAVGARTFAIVAAKIGMAVVSGFAIGADSIGHRAALEAGGGTICVMPCGLDKVFPPENRGLWEELLAYPSAAFVSEFGFGQRASSLLLRKRNKLIVAFAAGVLVAQSAVDGGAMNAYRFGREQKKPVATFWPDGSEATSGNAVIARDNRTGALAFESTGNGSNYEAWLRQLSSST